MAVTKAYYRTARQFVNGNYYAAGEDYVVHPAYAVRPENYIRAFELIQKDLLSLFESVEPADQNLATYSFRMHELLMRTCIELEANFKAILAANNYSNTGRLNITDYYKINTSHYLSDYEVRLPYWTGTRSARNSGYPLQPSYTWRACRLCDQPDDLGEHIGVGRRPCLEVLGAPDVMDSFTRLPARRTGGPMPPVRLARRRRLAPRPARAGCGQR